MLTDTSEPSVSRDKKCERLDELIGRKFFIEHFLRKSEEEIMGLDNDVLTKKQIMEEFLLQDEKEFISYMEKYHDLWENLYDCGDYDAGAGYGLIPKEKREQFFIETDREIKWLQETMGRNDAKNIKINTLEKNVRYEFLNVKPEKIHPVQSFHKGKAYTTAIISVNKIKLVDDTEKKITTTEKVLVCSDRREFQIINKKCLTESMGDNIFLSTMPESIEQRWDEESVLAFQNGLNHHYTFREIYDEIKKQLEFYIDIENRKLFSIITCWNMATYYFMMFDAFGTLNVVGTKQSGKSKLLDFSQLISFNGKMHINIKGASIYRGVHTAKYTLCLDEMDSSRIKAEGDLSELLRAGYMKGHVVTRQEQNSSGGYTQKEFDLFSPKILGSVTGSDDVIEDRGIRIDMTRTKNKKIGNRILSSKNPVWQEIRNKLYINMMERFLDVEKTKDMIEKWQQETDEYSECHDDKNKNNGIKDDLSQKDRVLESECSECEDSPDTHPVFVEGEKGTSTLKSQKDVDSHSLHSLHSLHSQTYMKHTLNEELECSNRKNDILSPSLHSYEYSECHDDKNKNYRSLMKNLANRNFQVAFPVITMAYLVGEDVMQEVIEGLIEVFETKRQDDTFLANDNTLLESLVEYVESGRWYKASHIADAVKMKTESEWANPKWVATSVRRIFPKLMRRRSSIGLEFWFTPEMVRDRATRNGLDVEDILKTATLNPYESMNSREKIKYKLKGVPDMEWEELIKWAEVEGVPRAEAEKIIQHSMNFGDITEFRLGRLRWVGY